jgi:hypothetical protein
MKKIDLIIYSPGCRGDFIQGWLSSLSDYDQFSWEIDNFSGRSYCNPFIRYLDKDKNLNFSTLFHHHYFQEFKNKNKILSICLHGNFIDNQIKEEDYKNFDFRIIKIMFYPKLETIAKIHWERTVKIYHPESKQDVYNKSFSSEFKKNQFELMQNNFKEIFYQKIEHYFNMSKKINKLKVNSVIIQYEEIIKPSGSYYLTEKLNLNITEKDHKYWETQLKKSHSPLEVTIDGKIFKYEYLLC